MCPRCAFTLTKEERCLRRRRCNRRAFIDDNVAIHYLKNIYKNELSDLFFSKGHLIGQGGKAIALPWVYLCTPLHTNTERMCHDLISLNLPLLLLLLLLLHLLPHISRSLFASRPTSFPFYPPLSYRLLSYPLRFSRLLSYRLPIAYLSQLAHHWRLSWIVKAWRCLKRFRDNTNQTKCRYLFFYFIYYFLSIRVSISFLSRQASI